MGPVVSAIAAILYLLLLLYVLVLLVRLVLDWIPMFRPHWRPKGPGLVLAVAVYTVTDPPLKFFRRFIKPLRVGGVALDFGFTITMLIAFVLLRITSALI